MKNKQKPERHGVSERWIGIGKKRRKEKRAKTSLPS